MMGPVFTLPIMHAERQVLTGGLSITMIEMDDKNIVLRGVKYICV